MRPFVEQEKKQKLGVVLDYFRKESPNWAPGLPRAIRDPGSWLKHGLGMEGGADDTITSLFRPLSSLTEPADPTRAQAAWLTPDYNHKGFLPVNDAVILGINLRQKIMDDRLQFDVHPYIGQNWHSADNYWGTELSLSLKSEDTGKAWGRISIRFTDGDEALMEHGSGFNMRSELKFDDHLSLNAGVRQNEDSQLGDYVILRWKVSTGF
ncbi:MAG: hypothetical protein WAO98_01450 [Alphaproteobacteria bacterium]